MTATVGVLAAAGCSQWRPPAATVNQTGISGAAVEADARRLADNPALSVALYQQDVSEIVTDNRAPAELTTQLLTQRIRQEVLRSAVAERQLTIAEEARAAARQQLDDAVTRINAGAATGQGALGTLDTAPADFVDRWVDFIAQSQALFADVAPRDQAALVAEIFAGVDVDVDPRFGTWDEATFAVVPIAPPTFDA